MKFFIIFGIIKWVDVRSFLGLLHRILRALNKNYMYM